MSTKTTHTMKDFLGNEIRVNDFVVFAQDHGRNPGASMQKGNVVGLTAKMVRIEYRDAHYGSVHVHTTLKNPNKVVAITPNISVAI